MSAFLSNKARLSRNILKTLAPICAFAGLTSLVRSADLPLAGGDRIVFLGDSLTYHAGFPSYSDYLTSYLVCRNPSLALHIQAVGRSGLSLEGCLDSSPIGYQHYSKYIEALSPKYVFVMFADNGGYDKATFKQYLNTVVRDYIIGKSGATPLLLGMIPQADADGFVPGPTYDEAIEEIALTATPRLTYFKTWGVLSATWRFNSIFTANASTGYLTSSAHGFTNGEIVLFEGGIAPAPLVPKTLYKITDASADRFRLADTGTGSPVLLTSNGSGTLRISSNWPKLRADPTDSVHPGPAASVIAAWKIITGLGWSDDVSEAVISASSRALISEKNCSTTTITPNAFGGIDFARQDARLPWAIDEAARAIARSLFPEMAGWQKYILKLNDLPSGTYRVYCEGEPLADVTAAALSAGWNMADLTRGPVWRQGQEVLGLIRDMQGMDRATLLTTTNPRVGVERYKSSASSAYQKDGKRGTELAAALSANLAELAAADELIHTAAQPKKLSFSVRRLVGNEPVLPATPEPGGNPTQPESSYVPPIGIPAPLWGALSPVVKSRPEPPASWPSAESSGKYYVDASHASATDTNNPFGYPAKPRVTIPESLTAGSVVTVASCLQNTTLTASGTEAQPVWLVGVGPAKIQPAATGGYLSIKGSSWLIVDGLNFDGTGSPDTSSSNAFSVRDGSHHVCIRNCSVKNMVVPPYDPSRFSSGGAGAWYSALTSLSPSNGDVTDIVLYRIDIRNNCGGQSLDYESGRHCFLASGDSRGVYRVENVWILDCTFDNNPEDGIQLGQTSNNASQTLCRNFFIGGNTITNNGENAIDLKACDRIVVSRNLLSGYAKTNYRAGAVSGSDGTACVINDDGHGPLESWWLFNTIKSSRVAFRNQAAGGNHYVIGNMISDLRKDAAESEPLTPGSSAGVAYWHSSAGTVHLVNNTVSRVHGGFYISNGSEVEISGNIVTDLMDHTAGWPVNLNNFTSSALSGNIYFDPDGPLRRDANALGTTDLVDTNPRLSTSTAGELTPLQGSPAIARVSSALSYNTFVENYGSTSGGIFMDFRRLPRPTTGWAAGAFEPVVTPPLTPPSRLRLRNQ